MYDKENAMVNIFAFSLSYMIVYGPFSISEERMSIQFNKTNI